VLEREEVASLDLQSPAVGMVMYALRDFNFRWAKPLSTFA